MFIFFLLSLCLDAYCLLPIVYQVSNQKNCGNSDVCPVYALAYTVTLIRHILVPFNSLQAVSNDMPVMSLLCLLQLQEDVPFIDDIPRYVVPLAVIYLGNRSICGLASVTCEISICYLSYKSAVCIS